MEEQTTPLRRKKVRFFAIVLTVLIIMVALLGLDLANRGAVWNVFWSLTGEEAPLAQIRGMVELAGTVIRPSPNTAPLTPIDHAGVSPFGVNTFLEQEVEIPKVREQLRMITAAGFRWIRQEFPWEDLEVDGRGQFTDSRSGETIDAWEKYDRIVDLTEEYGVQIQVRLSNPPDWSRANPDAGDQAPPDDFQDFVNYAVAVAERYRGRIHHYQVWNEPNIYPEWGNNFVDPVAYTELLCRTYDALKAVDPDIVVISGALAPTNALDGFFGYSDFIYLQNMYDAGAGDCFDVLSMQGYGLNSGPTDHRYRLTTVNYARTEQIRDIMVVNGDADKAIWISEAAWNPVPTEAENPDIADRYNYGQVTLDQAARWMPIAYQRAQTDWPWVGVINYWFFTRPHDFEANQSWFYFRMVQPDYSPERPTFTPLPIYHSMTDYIHNLTPVLYQGVHQGEHWAIEARPIEPDTEMLVPAPFAQFDDGVLTNLVTFTVQGTSVSVRWLGQVPGEVTFEVDGGVVAVEDGVAVMLLSRTPLPEDWNETIIHTSTQAETHVIRISSDAPFILDSVTVIDRGRYALIPIVGAAVAFGLMGIIGLLRLLWIRI